MSGLEVRGLCRSFGGIRVLDGVNFSVPTGQTAIVVGANGVGKTTLLRCIVGADRPDAGDVLFDGRPMCETDPAVRAAVAAVLDDMDFFPDLSVSEHLELLAFAHGGESGAIPGLLAESALWAVRNQMPATLSTGQRRRLALASCFARPRRLLILDEPEQRLDSGGRDWLVSRLIGEKAAGTTVLMASHNADLTRRVADQLIEMG